MNMNDISGFDAMTEEVRYVYAERDRLRDENKALLQFKKDICEVLGVVGNSHNDGVVKLLKAVKSRTNSEYEAHKYTLKKQEEFTEEAASILGVHPGDLTLSDVLEALRKLKRCEELNDMNARIIADVITDLKDKLDKETSRRIKAEEYACDASNNLEKICSALGIEYDINTTIEYVLDTIDDLKARSLEFNLRTENFRHLCDILGLEPNDTTWQDIFNEVESLRAKYLNLCGDFACCCNKLGLDCTESNRSNILAKIDDLRSKEGTYCHQSFVFNSVCDYLGITADDTTLSDIRKEIEKLKSWKTVAADHDMRRRNWVRKYKSEHERANSCDELYKKYKALYDSSAPERKKLYDDLETYRSSYEAVKNTATKNRSLMNTVAQIVGTVGMHDDVTMAGVLNVKKKANHWDILVDAYGEGTMRSLLENIGIDVSGDKGNGLFK